MLKHKLNYFALILTLVVLIASIGIHAIDYSRTGSISVTLRSSEGGHEPIGDVTLKLYKVADIDRSGYNLSYAYTADFEGCGISLDDLNASGLAEHLASYAAEHNISGRTEHGETVVFDNLELGLYLIVQEGSVPGYYQISPFLVSVPMTNSDGTGWDYDIPADPKVQPHPKDDNPDETRVSVKKVWVDTGDNRPDSVVITLMRDGEVYDTIILNKDNDWKYTWSGLDADYRWSIAEIDVPDNYKVSYSVAGATYTITNTEEPENPPDETTPDTGDETEPPDETEPDETEPIESEPPETEPDESEPIESEPESDQPEPDETKPDEADKPKLAQTGQLNWPIPILAVAGVLLFMIGWGITFIGKKSEK